MEEENPKRVETPHQKKELLLTRSLAAQVLLTTDNPKPQESTGSPKLCQLDLLHDPGLRVQVLHLLLVRNLVRAALLVGQVMFTFNVMTECQRYKERLQEITSNFY